MADLTLVKSYLREAALDDRTTATAQIAWLESLRKQLHAEAHEGDWAVTNQGSEGTSHSAARNETAKARLAAVIAAMERLEEQSGVAISTSRSGILIPQMVGGLHR